MKLSGVFIAIIGVFLFSAKAILVKLCYTYHIDTISVLTLRMGFSLPFFIVIGAIKAEKDKAPLDLKAFLYIVLLGVIGYYGASYFDFEGLQFIDASLERLILFIYPTIVVLLSAVIFRNKIKPKQVLAILITYVGLSCVFLPSLYETKINYNLYGIIMIVLSAITYASYLVASQHFVPKFGTVRFTTAAMVVSSLAVLTHYYFDDKASVFNLPLAVYGYGFIMAVFCTVLPSYMISEAINQIGAPKVSIIGSLGPVSTIGLSILVLGEDILIHEIIGGVIIVFGVVWLNYTKSTKK